MTGEDMRTPDHPTPIGHDKGPSAAPRGRKTAVPRLGVRQRRFVEEYLVDMSPVRAAERAGYAQDRAARTASRLLRSPAVLEAVEQAMRRRAARTEVTQDLVVRELAAVGFSVMTDLCHWSDEGVRLRDSTDLSRAQAAAVAEVRESSTARGGRPARGEQPDGPVRGGVQVKLHSKLKALEMLARHLGMFGVAAGGPGTSRTGCSPGGDALPDADAPPQLPPELRARIEELYPGRARGHAALGGDAWNGRQGTDGDDDDTDCCEGCTEDDDRDEADPDCRDSGDHDDRGDFDPDDFRCP